MQNEFEYDTQDGETLTVIGYYEGGVPKFSLFNEDGVQLNRNRLSKTDLENVMDLLYENIEPGYEFEKTYDD